MADVAFRTKSESTKPERVGEGKTPPTQSVTNVEVPYMDYEADKGHPYTVDYFKLGKYWDEGMGGFEKEVNIIEGYIQKKIKSGEWANNQEAIKKELKKMEKLTNVKDETRPIVKVATITAHIKFLQEAEGIRKDFAKYGNN